MRFFQALICVGQLTKNVSSSAKQEVTEALQQFSMKPRRYRTYQAEGWR